MKSASESRRISMTSTLPDVRNLSADGARRNGESVGHVHGLGAGQVQLGINPQATGRVEADERSNVGQGGAVSLENDDISQCNETTGDSADDECQAGVAITHPCTYRRHELNVATSHRVNHKQQEENPAAKNYADQPLK